MSISLLFSFLLACGDKDQTDDTADETTETEDENTEDTEDVNPDAPVIRNPTADCGAVGGSTEGDQWNFDISVSDPQGIENIPRLQTGGITVENSSGIAVATLDLVCDWNNENCFSNVFTDQVGLGCDQAEAVTIEFQIVDNDGNLSNTLSVNGRFVEAPAE